MDEGQVERVPSPDTAPPGWQPDPWQVAPYRWWDGAAWTGSVSPPSGGPKSEVDLSDQVEFVGGMNVPSALGGRLNATIPLVVLTIDKGNLRLHPRALAMFSDFEVPLEEVAAAFLLRGTFMTSGIGIELSDGQLAYFWTLGDKDAILTVLRQRGVRIDPTSRRAAGALTGQFGMLWGWRRPAPSVAKVPGYSRPMIALMPVFMVIGIAVISLFALQGTPFGWVAAVIGTVGLVRTFFLWREHRDT